MRRSKGFTLVELLVVIGIIALLISILLPSLTRARQAASLLACQSNMRQVYHALLFYAGDNKGFLPFASQGVSGSWNNIPGNGTNGECYIVLSNYLGRTAGTGNPPDDSPNDPPLNKVFTCTEALPADPTNAWSPNYQRTLKFNLRAMPGYDQLTPGWVAEYPQRKLASINDSSRIIAFWDGAQFLNGWNMTTEPSVLRLDEWRYSYGHMFLDPVPAGNEWDNGHLTEPILGGPNADEPDTGSWYLTSIRYRHMRTQKDPRGSKTPVGFFDGHVEARGAKEMITRDFCLSHK